MKKFLITLFCIMISTLTVSATQTVDEMKWSNNFAEQVKKERSTISNALHLTNEQAKKRVEITQKSTKQLEEKFQQLYSEQIKLKTMQANNEITSDINAQKNKINCLKKEIKNIVDNENKEFKKILDRDQRNKLSMIQKLQRKSMKDAQKVKDYAKSNPKMRPFAQY